MSKETSFVRRVIIVIGILSIVFLLALAAHFALKIFLMIFVGALLAVFYRGCSYWLGSKLKIKPGKILPFVILFHVLVSVGVIYLLSPKISEQVNVMVDEIPESFQKLKQEFYNTEIGKIVSKNLPEDESLSGDSASFISTIFDFFTISLGVLVDILLIYIFALFLALNPGLYRDGFILLFPVQRRERIRGVWETVNVTLFKWFIGMIVDMSSIFIMTALALWIMDIPLVLTLALIAFLFSFVPNIGPIVSAIPAILIAFTKEPIYAVYVGCAYLGIQLLESYLVTPNVQSSRKIGIISLSVLSHHRTYRSVYGGLLK